MATETPETPTSTPSTRLADLLPPDLVAAALPAEPARLAPSIDDQDRWREVAETDRAEIIAAAEELSAEPWPVLLASQYARFHLEGNRTGYEEPYFQRRSRLIAATLAAALTGEEKWIREAVDGIELICDELTWTVPAHSWKNRQRNSPLPSPDDLDLDLFCAETGSVLAWTDQVLAPALDRYAVTVRPRLRAEVTRRVLEPYRTRQDWPWLTTSINNWNPWIHSNVLACALLLEIDPAARAEIVNLSVAGLDVFLDSYHPDGGCDEGASYWGRAGGSLADCLTLLADATGGRLDGFAHPKVEPIATYLPAAHIGGGWYVNFADGPARQQDRTLAYPLFRLGRATGNEIVTRHATMINAGGAPLIKRLSSFGRVLGVLFTRELGDVGVDRPTDHDHFWYPQTEVLTARVDGVLLAAKGGHNAESHNHNDVGNVVIAVDGEPMVVDIGVGTYTKQTFSPDRYQIFTMQSEFHNLPVINGHGQLPGAERRSRGMSAELSQHRVESRVDIADAYPAEAGIESWLRESALGDAGVLLTDRWRLTDRPKSLVWHLIVRGEPTLSEGSIDLPDPAGGRGLVIGYAPEELEVTTQAIALTDPRLSDVWGPELTRLVLTATPALLQQTGELALTFRPS
ncbi:MAG TPA: heparinase II/III family protein [Microlunatus sp.]|nr:heparinase II/III family protein [Microlunatus sp.]